MYSAVLNSDLLYQDIVNIAILLLLCTRFKNILSTHHISLPHPLSLCS